MSSGGAKADRSTVSASSLGDSTTDEYTAVKNTNAHVSGNIEEVAPHDDDEETTTTQTTKTTTTKQHNNNKQQQGSRSGGDKDVTQMASEGWEAAKIKGAEVYNAAKEKVNEYTERAESNKDDSSSSSKGSSSSKQAKSAASDAMASVQDTASDLSNKASAAANTASKKASETASDVSKKASDTASDVSKKASAAAEVASQKASETAKAASQKASELYNQAHDTIQQQTGSDKPLREQARDAASVASAKASEAAASASETAQQYGTAARQKAGDLYNQAHDTIQQQTGSDQPLRQQAASKASEWASTLEAAAETAKEKIVEYAGIAQQKAAEAYKSASSSSAISNVTSMLGMGGDPDKTVTTSTYESREQIVEKDEATGTAKVQKHETWTEQTNNGPKKENSKDSQYTTTLGKDGKL